MYAPKDRRLSFKAEVSGRKLPSCQPYQKFSFIALLIVFDYNIYIIFRKSNFYEKVILESYKFEFIIHNLRVGNWFKNLVLLRRKVGQVLLPILPNFLKNCP